jgi:hypothetical protein
MVKLLWFAAVMLTLLDSASAGSYLGCFDKSKWQYSHQAFSTILNGTRWTVDSCEEHCGNKAYSLMGLSNSYTECLCGINIPNGAAQLPDASCNGTLAGNATLLFYREWGKHHWK